MTANEMKIKATHIMDQQTAMAADWFRLHLKHDPLALMELQAVLTEPDPDKAWKILSANHKEVVFKLASTYLGVLGLQYTDRKDDDG